MMRTTFLGYVVAVLCGLVALTIPNGSSTLSSSSVVVDAACATARVRKNYDALTLAERQLYREALQSAMDRGYYIKFVEMHMEKMSEMEAHRVCMFTYWHRYFLLGFENMLRGMDTKFECLTIPYWDQMQQNARAMTGACTSLQNCSLITRDMGGSTVGVAGKGLSINGAWVTGDRCVSAAPLNRFCESSSKTGTAACAKCLPRSNLLQKKFPSATNFASVYRQLFTSGGLTATGKSVEDGMHNAIHAELGATMGTFQSPADPLFWSHHAYVDLLLTIYLKCRVGLGVLTTDALKMNNQFSFVQCPHREDAGFFTATSTVTMRNGEVGTMPKQVNVAGQALYPFFQGLPSKYYQLSDVTQLGANKYTYQVGGLVGQMATKCDAATGPTTRRRRGRKLKQHRGCESDLAEDDAPSPVLPSGLPEDHSDDNDASAAKVNAWVADVRQQLGSVDDKEAAQQLENMVCLFYDQCRGGVEDYSDEFKKAFNVNEPPPCKRIVDELKAATKGGASIKLPDWKERMEKYFPCDVAPTPAPYGSSD